MTRLRCGGFAVPLRWICGGTNHRTATNNSQRAPRKAHVVGSLRPYSPAFADNYHIGAPGFAPVVGLREFPALEIEIIAGGLNPITLDSGVTTTSQWVYVGPDNPVWDRLVDSRPTTAFKAAGSSQSWRAGSFSSFSPERCFRPGQPRRENRGARSEGISNHPLPLSARATIRRSAGQPNVRPPGLRSRMRWRSGSQ